MRATCAASGLEKRIPPDYNLEGKMPGQAFSHCKLECAGQVYLADALEEFSAVPGGQPVDPESQGAEPRAKDDSPNPP